MLGSTGEDRPTIASATSEATMLTDQLLQEIEAGQGETLTHAARRVPRTRQDKPVTLGCLIRWVSRGVKGPDGERIRLEAARLAGRWVTTPGAIRRFVEAQTPRDAECAPTKRPPGRRRRASERAAKELERAGI
jgi:hypothetical protein